METGQMKDIWIKQAKAELHKLVKSRMFLYIHYKLAMTGKGGKLDKK